MSTDRPLSVLIVDGQSDATVSLAAALQRAGHRVRTAESAGAGWAAALAERPDVAVLDVGARNGSGYDLAEELSELPGGPPVVVGWGDGPGDPVRATRGGISRHFATGGDPAELLAYLLSCRQTG